MLHTENERCGARIRARGFNEDVMKVVVAPNVQEAAVLLRRQRRGPAGERGDLISEWRGSRRGAQKQRRCTSESQHGQDAAAEKTQSSCTPGHSPQIQALPELPPSLSLMDDQCPRALHRVEPRARARAGSRCPWFTAVRTSTMNNSMVSARARQFAAEDSGLR